VLELDLTELPAAPEPGAVARLRARGRHRLLPTLRALYEAAGDRHVGGLIAKVGGPLPWAGMQEIRLAVRAFAASGKPTVAWAESFGEGSRDMSAYVLATGFDEIWLQPGGGLGVLGVGVETTFVRGLLDRVGIEPQLEQRYEYKSAADQLMRSDFTDAHRAALDRLTESVFGEAVAAIAQARQLTPDRVRTLVDTGPRTAPEALAVGLVDALGYRDSAYESVRSRVAAGSELLFADRWRPSGRRRLRPSRRGYVALVEIHGAIGSRSVARGPLRSRATSDLVCAALRAAARDPGVRAVVLHIDSPGGSAVASEAIWHEVCRVREAGKPVIASMGRLAASGGYYVACPADVILALPATLTGSIGVFGGKLVVGDLLDRVGLSTGTVSRGERSLMYSARRVFSAGEHERLAATLDAIYTDFVAKVALGRGREVSEIEAIARGRVWTGADALGIGLVDELGGLRDAMRIARARAGLPTDAAVRHPLRVSTLSRLRRPRNSEDPRAWNTAGLAGVTELLGRPAVTELLGRPASTALLMPSVRLL
jgi:protease-4